MGCGACLQDNISLRRIVIMDSSIEQLRPRIEQVLRPELRQRDIMEYVNRTFKAVANCDRFLTNMGRPRYKDVRRQLLIPILFRTALESLSRLCADERHLGGKIGTLAVLHTWTRTLE